MVDLTKLVYVSFRSLIKYLHIESHYQLVVTCVLMTSLLTDNVTPSLRGWVPHPISLSYDRTAGVC